MTNNQETYSSEKVIHHYTDYEALQKPEQTIFQLHAARLGQMNMLDIGVGGGRTTSYFAPLVKSYTGVDYSDGMIKACRTKFSSTFPTAQFATVDVRDLSRFQPGSFDLVLFSFNGMDYITFEDRSKALCEIQRVLAPGGCFIFSTHNIQSLSELFKWRFRLNLLEVFKRRLYLAKIKRINKVSFKRAAKQDHIAINDGAHDFGLRSVYIKPSVQLKLLEDNGFEKAQVYALSTGLLLNESEIEASTDDWLYYTAHKGFHRT